MVYDEDDGAEKEGPVIVKRAIYEAGMKLEGAVKAGDPPAFETARGEAAKFREDGRAEDAAFWEEVFEFLMWRESVGAGTVIIILEEGETWDADEGEVIRPGARRQEEADPE
jgi:hypothetical protein